MCNMMLKSLGFGVWVFQVRNAQLVKTLEMFKIYLFLCIYRCVLPACVSVYAP